MTARRERRLVIAIILGLALARFVAARWIHLTEDEAYYRLWAQNLQFGYYDHPPMIAWWIRAGMSIVGDNPLGVRLLPIVAVSAATWLVADLARTLGAASPVPLRAAVWYNATITVGLGGILATPDAPTTLFWVSCLWALAKASRAQPYWWIVAGAAAGLAALSKYSALFLAPGVLLWMAVDPAARKQLSTRWPWLAAVAGLSLFAVNVFWNADHHWVTFAKQFGRVLADGLQPRHAFEFLLSQFFLLNPVVAIYALGALQRARSNDGSVAGTRLVLPIATSAPFAAYLLIHSFHDRVQGHWPVVLFPAIVVCAAAAAEHGAQGLSAKWWRGAGVAAGYGLSAAALVYMAAPQSHGLATFDPILALRGWREFSVTVDQLSRRRGAAWVGTVSYGSLAQLSAEGLVRAPLVQLTERDRYDGFAPSGADLSRPGLVVDLSRRLPARGLANCFGRVQMVSELDRSARGFGPAAHYQAFLVSEPRLDVLRLGCPGLREGGNRRK